MDPDPVISPAASPWFADGREFAVVRLVSVTHECSGAGGEHYAFEIEEPAHLRGGLAHLGGHAVYLGLIPSAVSLAHTPRPAAGVQRYVVELAMTPPVDEDTDANPDSSRAGWCLSHLPRFDASITRALPAADADEAGRLLARVTEDGMPPPTVEVRPAAGPVDIGVARVVDVSHAGHVVAEGVHGSVATAFERPDVLLMRGDLIVMESEATAPQRTVTRLMVAHDRADAIRWDAHVRAHGWPPMPIDIGSIATARWAIAGKVAGGPPGCGPEIEVPHAGYGSNLSLPRMVAPAPTGVQHGETVLAVVTARFEPDGCGHTLHTARAYLAPPGLTRDQLRRNGVPAGLTALAD